MSTQKNQTKKFVVLFATFIIPLLFFLFLASGKVNFEKLPILTENVGNIPQTSGVSLLDKISVVVFLGEDTTLGSVQQLLNLYQVVYKSTEKYNKFQVVVLVEENPQNIKKLTSELAFVGGVDLKKWHFVPVSSENTKTLFQGLKVPFELQENNSSSKAILIDDEWIPKSQIIDVTMVQRKHYDGENNFELVTIPQLTISSYFDKTNNNKRQKGYAF